MKTMFISLLALTGLAFANPVPSSNPAAQLVAQGAQATAALPDCCQPDAACCQPGADCCQEKADQDADCCVPGAACCETGADCCE